MTARTQRQDIDGTIVWSRSSGRDSDVCVCCDGAHVSHRGIEAAEGGRLDYLTWIDRAIHEFPEGAHVRLSLALVEPRPVNNLVGIVWTGPVSQ